MSSQSNEERVLDAAERLLQAAASSDFTMEQLEAASGISRATIYRHLGSKEQILQRLARERRIDTGNQADARTRILRAARIVFGRYGLLRPTMEQIAQEAGVGVATVYRHFGDKESLVQAFLQEYTPRRQIADAIVNPSGNLEIDLTHLVLSFLRFLSDNRDMIRLSFAESQATLQYLERLRGMPERTMHRLARHLEIQIAGGRLPSHHDPQQLALALLGMVFAYGFVAPTYYGIPLGEPEQIGRFIVRLFLNGVAEKNLEIGD